MNSNHGFPPPSGRNDLQSIPAVAGGGTDTVPTSKGTVPFIHREPAIPPPMVLGDRPAGTITYARPERTPALRLRRLGIAVLSIQVLDVLEREARYLRTDLQEARDNEKGHLQEVRLLNGHNRILTTANAELSREVADLRDRLRRARDQAERHEEADRQRREAKEAREAAELARLADARDPGKN